MRHFNSALEGEPPIANLAVLVRCVADFPCANLAQLSPGAELRIGETGEAVFNYVGENLGLDRLEVVRDDNESFEQLALIEVNWIAQGDMVVPAFIPPVILAGEGDTIFITDRTSNIGTVSVEAPTRTTYYISNTDPVDIATASVLGGRDVPALAAGQFDDSIETPFQIPGGFTGEIQFLAACADSENSVVESDESNNCSFSEVTREFDPVMVGDDPTVPVPIISVTDSSGVEGDFGELPLIFDVSISASDPDSNVTVNLTTEDGSAIAGEDYADTNVEVIFPAATTVLVQPVPVTVFGDFDVELDETFTVHLSDPSPNSQIGTGMATGTVENDDLTTATVGDTSALEGNVGPTPFFFPVMIDQAHTTEDIIISLETVDVSAHAGSDYVASTQTVIFGAGTTDLSQSISVDVLGDQVIESDEEFTDVNTTREDRSAHERDRCW